MFTVFRSIQGRTTSNKPHGPTLLRERVSVDRPNKHPQARIIPVLRGFDVEFSGQDHHLWQLSIEPRIDGFDPNGTDVDFSVVVGLRDSSGDWDDGFRCSVAYQLVVIDGPEVSSHVDTIGVASAPPKTGPARGDGHFSEQVAASHQSFALMSGFSIRYKKEDHHVLKMGAELHVNSRPAASDVARSVSAAVTLRDSSGNWDDAFGGTVTYALLTFPPNTVAHTALQFGFAGKSDFPVETRGRAYEETRDVSWDGAIPFNRIIAGMFGFQLGFNNGDHEFGRAVSRLEHQIAAPGTSPTQLRCAYEGGLRDKSGNWDDPYFATATYHLIGARG